MVINVHIKFFMDFLVEEEIKMEGECERVKEREKEKRVRRLLASDVVSERNMKRKKVRKRDKF